ncbi:hypothetical protein JCM10213_004176 [Rhodosporidiobolus nylandii]
MDTDSLKATASIWSRLPNEEKLRTTNRGRSSPSSHSSDSHTSTAAKPAAKQTRLSLAATHAHAHLNPVTSPFLPSLSPQELHPPSPRSSVSSANLSSRRTPESSHSPPRDRLAHPPAGAGPLKPRSPFSPPQGASGSLYSDSQGASGGRTASGARGGAHSGSAQTPSGVTVPASTSHLSPHPSSSQPVSTPSPSSNSAQPLLAEIFSGNPRPHYRPPPPPQQSPQRPYPSSPLHHPHPDEATSSALISPPLQPEGRSYFAAPPPDTPHGRARSQSSAPSFDFDKPRSSVSPVPMNGRGGISSSVGGSHRASIATPGAAAASGPADQHGWRPSGSSNFSASLPTTSAVGSPSFSSSLRELEPSPQRGGYSPFGPSLSTSMSTSSIPTAAAADPQTGWRASTSTGLSHSFSAGWNDETFSSSAEREGRSRFRDEWGSTSAPGGVNLSSSASSAGAGGIGMSNMSPFTRDGGRPLVDLPGAGLGDGGTWGSLGAAHSGVAVSSSLGVGGAGGAAYRTRREYSLGAVGSGRKRSDSAWGRGERLTDMHEDGAEDDDVFAPPTRSGATSRRHSFAAFDPHPPSRGTSLGFHLPEESRHAGAAAGGGSGGGFGPLLQLSSAASNGYGGGGGGLGSSAINDDDLAADLNSLHLNLEAHVAAGEPGPSRFSHVGSMPVDFPPARASRAGAPQHEPSPSRSNAQPAPSPPKASTSTQFPQAGSPRATAEPFTPSMTSSSVSTASRFFQSTAAPAPLPPTTTPATATATGSSGAGASRFDFGGAFAQAPQAAYGRFGGLPPPVPPPPTQHQYYSAAPSSGPLSPRGGLPPLNGAPFPSFGQPSPSIPPPHVPHQQQLQSGYFAPPPPPPPLLSPLGGGAPALTAQSQVDMNLGRGVPLHAIPPDAPLCIVGFKAGRKDLFFVEDPNLHLQEGDLVIVEADRGRDVGKYLKACSVDEVHKFQQHLVELALGQLANPNAQPAQPQGQQGGGAAGPAQLARMTKECQPKRIYGKAGPADTHALLAKAQDEVKALALVRSKVAQKGLPMEILDAEWQWDRRKLTFYYTADQRVDFRELVRELFRIWKTRVWLCCLDQQQPSFDFK